MQIINISDVIRTADSIDLKRGLAKILAEAAVDIRATFLEPAKTWDKQPVFEIEWDGINFEVGTDDDVYSWINDGTQIHFILPKNPIQGRLSFMVGGSPKTVVGSLESTSGARGDTIVSAKAVVHPGIKARHYDEIIAEDLENYLAETVQRKLDELFGD